MGIIKTFLIKDKIAVQLSIPSYGHNGFGYYVNLKTMFVVGLRTIAIIIFGIGFSITFEKNESTRWMWSCWNKMDV